MTTPLRWLIETLCLIGCSAAREAQLFELRLDGGAGTSALEAFEVFLEGAADVVHGGVEVENIDQRQLVARAHLEVVRVMRRRDLHRARAEFFVDVGVADDDDFAVGEERVNQLAPDQSSVSFVVGV